MATKLKPRDPGADNVGAHVRLTPADYETVRAMATRERRSISAQLSVIVTSWLETQNVVNNRG